MADPRITRTTLTKIDLDDLKAYSERFCNITNTDTMRKEAIVELLLQTQAQGAAGATSLGLLVAQVRNK